MFERQTAISLFTSGGIGDLAIRAAGFDILVSNELIDERHAVFSHNFPAATCITGDIWKSVDAIVDNTAARLGSRKLDLLYATPPCQGMSKNGRGKLLSAIRAGQKSPFDVRNRLIIPTIEVAQRLRPEIVLLENVPEMAQTLILDREGKPIQVVDFIARELGPEYVGRAEVVEFANYGVPQCRQRLISVFSRHPNFRKWFAKGGTFIPEPTHHPSGRDGLPRWVTVRDAISDLPALDARNQRAARSKLTYHRVPLLDDLKYWWVQRTPLERSAFDNQCDQCGFAENPVHSARRNQHGINRASEQTPLHCQRCGALLPRPSVERNGKRQIMRGFTSAYKRMSYDRPASALTRNLSYACSDNKLHPEQNRVLSLLEAFRLHTIDRYVYQWQRPDGKPVSDKTIREIIGESIPPAGFQIIVEHLRDIYLGNPRRTSNSIPDRNAATILA